MKRSLCGQNYDSGGVYHTKLSGPRIASDKVRWQWPGTRPALSL